MAIYCGCDVGSTTGKIVLIDENKNILGWSIVRSAKGPQATADNAMKEALAMAGLPEDTKVDYAVSTGYGRNNVAGMNEDISEISCHARGAHHANPNVQTIVDIGGQDCKVISINKRGRVVEFQMNDKCSAGTGRFFEVMTRVLDCSFEELADNALKSSSPRQISKQCSVFAESEVISLINSLVPVEDIAAGIHESIARRIHGMLFKVGINPDVALTGGCARNKALVAALQKLLKLELAPLNVNPQIMGALGAALFALEHATEG
ncbi:MAG: CoA activase [Duodenibacillus sp.]|nr:CoA activase [Duodenibacillus sp.]